MPEFPGQGNLMDTSEHPAHNVPDATDHHWQDEMSFDSFKDALRGPRKQPAPMEMPTKAPKLHEGGGARG